MSTLIDPSTTPESVVALVSTWRYMKHRLETSIDLLKKHRVWVRNRKDVEGLSFDETSDLIENLTDLLARGTELERRTFPEDYRKKSTLILTKEPSSMPVVETLE